MKTILLISVILLIGANISYGKIFTKCSLYSELKRLGMPLADLPNWICLVKAESAFNSGRKGPKNKNGSFDWGLFQINDKYWCRDGSVGGDCNMDCNKFLNDDITDDVKCAQKIFKRHGYMAWYGWRAQCKNKPLPDLSDC